MSECTDKDLAALTKEIKGEVISRIYKADDAMDDFLVIETVSGKKIGFRYNWIYGFNVEDK